MSQPDVRRALARPSLLWINQFALLPTDGGGTRHFELGRELVKKGWAVTVMASDLHLHRRTYTRRGMPSNHSVIREVVDGVEFQWLWAASYEANNWRRAWNWLSFRNAIRSACERVQRPDVVVGSSPQLLAAHAARSVARKFGVPFVFEVRDLWPESLLAAGGTQGLGYHLLDRLAWSLYEDADKVLVLAKGSQRYLQDRGVPAEKLFYIPNGVDVHAVVPAAGGPGHSNTLNRPFTVIYAGAHGPANGLDRVLEAAEILIASCDVRFLLVGDGPAKQQLVDDARRRGLDNMEFRSAVSKAELVNMLGAADAALMVLRDSPLFSYGVSPNKLFDYLAAGVPVVCNVPGEVADMVREARAGIQADDSSGLALAQAVRRLTQVSAQDRQRMRESGREWVKREHSREVLGDRLNDFLRALI